MLINWLELIAFVILFFIFKRITNIQPGKLLALAGLFPFFLPFTDISNVSNPDFISTYIHLLAHYFIHVGIGAAVGIGIEELL